MSSRPGSVTPAPVVVPSLPPPAAPPPPPPPQAARITRETANATAAGRRPITRPCPPAPTGTDGRAPPGRRRRPTGTCGAEARRAGRRRRSSETLWQAGGPRPVSRSKGWVVTRTSIACGSWYRSPADCGRGPSGRRRWAATRPRARRHGHRRVTRTEEVGEQRVDRSAVDGPPGGHQRLARPLAAEHPLAAVNQAPTPEVVDLDGPEVEQLDKRVEGLGHVVILPVVWLLPASPPTVVRSVRRKPRRPAPDERRQAP